MVAGLQVPSLSSNMAVYLFLALIYSTKKFTTVRRKVVKVQNKDKTKIETDHSHPNSMST